MKKLKVAVIYRVLQDWRLPVFERLGMNPCYDFMIFYGPDFIGTKVVSTKKSFRFRAIRVPSIRLKYQSTNGIVAMPISPLLFFFMIRHRPDILVCEGASNLFNALLSYFYKVIFRKKMIWWSLGRIEGRKFSKFRQVIERLVVYLEKHSDAIMVYSNYGRKYYQKLKIPDKKIFVPVNVVDTEARLMECAQYNKIALYQESHKHYKMVILFVGALEKNKKIEILIKAFSKMEMRYPGKVKLTIVGDGSYRERLESVASSLNIQHIEFTGKVIEGVNRYFLQSDVFVMPGLGGLAVSDAMVHGLTVIASIGDGCEKDLVTPETGILEKDLTEDRLFQCLVELFENPGRLPSLKKNAYNKIINQYNISTYMDEIYRCIGYVR